MLRTNEMMAIKALESANLGLSRPLDLCLGRISSLYNSAAAARPRAPHVEDVSRGNYPRKPTISAAAVLPPDQSVPY